MPGQVMSRPTLEECHKSLPAPLRPRPWTPCKVTDENKQLLRQLDETQRENYEVTEYLRQELLLKTEKIAELDAEIAKVLDL